MVFCYDFVNVKHHYQMLKNFSQMKCATDLMHVSHLLLSVKNKAFWAGKEFGAGQYSFNRKAFIQH